MAERTHEVRLWTLLFAVDLAGTLLFGIEGATAAIYSRPAHRRGSTQLIARLALSLLLPLPALRQSFFCIGSFKEFPGQ